MIAWLAFVMSAISLALWAAAIVVALKLRRLLQSPLGLIALLPQPPKPAVPLMRVTASGPARPGRPAGPEDEDDAPPA